MGGSLPIVQLQHLLHRLTHTTVVLGTHVARGIVFLQADIFRQKFDGVDGLAYEM